MLIYDFKEIGNKLLAVRKRSGLTQSEVAEAAGLSDRTYADIERGNVNMRVETMLKICDALNITPNDIMTDVDIKQDREKLKTLYDEYDLKIAEIKNKILDDVYRSLIEETKAFEEETEAITGRLLEQTKSCSDKQKETMLNLLSVYLKSIK